MKNLSKAEASRIYAQWTSKSPGPHFCDPRIVDDIFDSVSVKDEFLCSNKEIKPTVIKELSKLIYDNGVPREYSVDFGKIAVQFKAKTHGEAYNEACRLLDRSRESGDVSQDAIIVQIYFRESDKCIYDHVNDLHFAPWTPVPGYILNRGIS